MDGTPNIAKIGALLGDNTRARMLSTLMHGKALTATELARETGVTAPTASSHLARLEAGGLICVRKQGRHKYFTLAGEKVASLLETLMGLTAGSEPLRTSTGPQDSAMREARVCYNHLAGTKGTELYDSLIDLQYLQVRAGQIELTDSGLDYMRDFGIDIDVLLKARAPVCKSCLDWSERRTHLAGSLGRALYSRFETLNWVRRNPGSRIVRFTPKGKAEFRSRFGS